MQNLEFKSTNNFFFSYSSVYLTRRSAGKIVFQRTVVSKRCDLEKIKIYANFSVYR